MNFKLIFYSVLVAFFSALISLIYFSLFIDSWKSSISALVGIILGHYFYYLNKEEMKKKK